MAPVLVWNLPIHRRILRHISHVDQFLESFGALVVGVEGVLEGAEDEVEILAEGVGCKGFEEVELSAGGFEEGEEVVGLDLGLPEDVVDIRQSLDTSQRIQHQLYAHEVLEQGQSRGGRESRRKVQTLNCSRTLASAETWTWTWTRTRTRIRIRIRTLAPTPPRT